jgi:hypothetical protein
MAFQIIKTESITKVHCVKSTFKDLHLIIYLAVIPLLNVLPIIQYNPIGRKHFYDDLHQKPMLFVESPCLSKTYALADEDPKRWYTNIAFSNY